MWRYISYEDTLHSPLCAEWASRLIPAEPRDDAIRYAKASRFLTERFMADPLDGTYPLLLGTLPTSERVYLRMRTTRIPSGHGGMASFILERTRTTRYMWVRTEDGILWEAPISPLRMSGWIPDRSDFVEIAGLIQFLMEDITSSPPEHVLPQDVSPGLLNLIEKEALTGGSHTVFPVKKLKKSL